MQDTDRTQQIEKRLETLEGILRQLFEDNAYAVHLLERVLSQLPCVGTSHNLEVMQ